MCSGSEAGSYLRPIDFVYHSTLGLRVIKKKGSDLDSEKPRGSRVGMRRVEIRRAYRVTYIHTYLPTRWSSTLSSKDNLHHAICCRAVSDLDSEGPRGSRVGMRRGLGSARSAGLSGCPGLFRVTPCQLFLLLSSLLLSSLELSDTTIYEP